MKASTTLRRLDQFFGSRHRASGDFGAQILGQLGRSIACSRLRMASAPIMAVKLSLPYSSWALLELVFGQELTLFQRRQARLDDEHSSRNKDASRSLSVMSSIRPMRLAVT